MLFNAIAKILNEDSNLDKQFLPVISNYSSITKYHIIFIAMTLAHAKKVLSH